MVAPASPAPSRRFGPPVAGGNVGLAAVVGHAPAKRFLAERLRAASLPHALLFTGPRGVGKRTLAQALAAEILCESANGCGRCRDCRALLHGNHAALVEIECAPDRSVIPIEAIKALEHELSLAPPDARGRVSLLLGADRTTPAAQDALLKTLEEPRRDNVLVLTAVRTDALLPTLRSRCQRFALVPLSDEEVGRVAARLCVAGVPASAALGCPGELLRLADPTLARVRIGVLDLLLAPRGREDLARLLALLHDGIEEEAPLESVRARARQILRFLASFQRDADVLRISGAVDRVRASDQIEKLSVLARRPGRGAEAPEGAASRPIGGSGRVARLAAAHDRIDGSVDPASVLFAVLHPEIDVVADAGAP